MSEFESNISIPVLQETATRLGPDVWRQASDVAQVVASYLSCHPRVVTVRYPGLKADPLFAEASVTLQRGFGPYVWFETARGEQLLDCTGEHDAKALILKLEQQI